MARQWWVAGLLLLAAGCGGSGRPQTALERAEANLKSGEWDQAIEDCTRLIAADPNNGQAFLIRGQAHQCAGRPNEALSDLDNAIRLNPEDAEGYYQRADVYRSLGKIDLKEKDDLAARERDPVFKENHFQREDLLSADPTIREVLPAGASTDDPLLSPAMIDGPDADVDLAGVRPHDDLTQPKSVAETLYGPPPGPIETEQPSKSRLRRELEKQEAGDPSLADESDLDAPKKAGKRAKARPRTPSIVNSPVPGGLVPGGGLPGKQSPAAAGKDKGLAGGAGQPLRRRAPQVEMPPKAQKPIGDQLIPGEHGDRPDDYAKYLPGARSLRPYDVSAMRSTGLQEFTPTSEVPPGSQYGPQRIDPYGGLSSQRRSGQTPGQTGQSSMPYGASPGSRGAAPARPRVSDPPGLRYDGGY